MGLRCLVWGLKGLKCGLRGLIWGQKGFILKLGAGPISPLRLQICPFRPQIWLLCHQFSPQISNLLSGLKSALSDLKPDGWTEMKVPLCSTGLCLLQGPASSHSNSLTTYYPWGEIKPLRLKISNFRPEISNFRPKTSSSRLELSPLMPEFSPPRPKISPFRFNIIFLT